MRRAQNECLKIWAFQIRITGLGITAQKLRVEEGGQRYSLDKTGREGMGVYFRLALQKQRSFARQQPGIEK